MSEEFLKIVGQHVTGQNFPLVFLAGAELLIIAALLWVLVRSICDIRAEIEEHRTDDAGLHTRMLQTIVDMLKPK